jgi:hypothetical protein
VRSGLAIGAFACLLVAGCIPPPGPRPPSYKADPRPLSLNALVIFQGSTGPLSQQTSTLHDVHGAIPTRRVSAEECQHGIQIPISALIGSSASFWLSAGWGQGGYLKALAHAQEKAEGGYLTDVRVDLRSISVLLGIYLEQCIIVDAGVVPKEAVDGPIATPPPPTPPTGEPPPTPPPSSTEPPPNLPPPDQDAGSPVNL